MAYPIDHYLVAQAQKAAGAQVHEVADILSVYYGLVELGTAEQVDHAEKIIRYFIRTGKLAPKDVYGYRQIALIPNQP